MTRIRDTGTQTRLNAAQRLRNVRNAFRVQEPDWIDGRRVLLCDENGVLIDGDVVEQTKQVMQLSVNNTYDDFISNVAELRGMEKEAVDQVAQGQVWIAEDALAHGLIDELGDYDYAVAAAAELAGLEEDSYGSFEIAVELSATEQAILDFLAVAKSAGLDPSAFVGKPTQLEVFATRFDEALSEIAQFNDPNGTYSHCFCELD